MNPTIPTAFQVPLWIGTKDTFLNEIQAHLDQRNPTGAIHTLNPEILIKGYRNRAYLELLKTARWNTVDGVGLQMALRRKGIPVPTRLCGSDLIFDLAALCLKNGRPLYIVGGTPSRLGKAIETLIRQFPGLVVRGHSPGFGPNDAAKDLAAITADLHSIRPAFVAVCLGAPRQEHWIADNRAMLTEAGVAVAGGFGGTVDFLSGEVVRAPLWVQKFGMEWLYRLLTDTSRLKRQLSTLPLFALFALTGGKFSK
jgi:N-acetylglucosaminyldiphosphoundecaprenol N-acetyl-beta-D-mannosaminyltransferase